MRIQKLLSEQGICSRRKAEELIKVGKIVVNGRKAVIGQDVTENDVILIDGVRAYFQKKVEHYYIALYKPRGYVTTLSDELGRKNISDLVKDIDVRLYPVGRLDKDSEGLIFMTNDGEFAKIVTHPSSQINKTYRVTVRSEITEEKLITMSTSAPVKIEVETDTPSRAVLRMTISEGKNHEIRNICEGVGLEVARLKRVSIGPVKLGMLKPGEYRELKKEEVSALKNVTRKGAKK